MDAKEKNEIPVHQILSNWPDLRLGELFPPQRQPLYGSLSCAQRLLVFLLTKSLGHFIMNTPTEYAPGVEAKVTRSL